MFKSISQTPLTHSKDEPVLRGIALAGSADEDPEVLAAATAPSPEYHYEEQADIVFYDSGWEMHSDRLVEVYGRGKSKVMVMDDPILAVGYYLHLLELHDIPEDEVMERVDEFLGDLYQTYQDWLSELSIRDRRFRLLDQAEQDSQQSDFYDPILENGTWRQTGLSQKNRHQAKQFIKRESPNPKHCYKNALKAIDTWWNDTRVEYYEGIALSKHAGRITGHSWVEIEGKVAELTWPWHRPDPPKEAIYFGVSLPREELKEYRDKMEQGPHILDIDNPEHLG